MPRCERSGGVSGNVLLKISEVVGVNDWGISNSGGLKISISTWMYNLSIYFDYILILTNVSYSI